MRWLRLLVVVLTTTPWSLAATFVWNGSSGDGVYTNPANWTGGAVPPNDGSAVLVFGNAGAGSVVIPSSITVAQIRFENSAGTSYQFASTGLGLISLQQGLVSSLNGGSATFDNSLALNLAHSQTFAVNAGKIEIQGRVVGPGTLTKSGSGMLELEGLNLWTGGLQQTAGTLALGSVGNLGTGTLRVSGGNLAFTAQENSVVLNPVVIETSTSISGTFDHFAVFAGPVTLANSVTLTTSTGSGVFFSGGLKDSGNGSQLTVAGMTPVILSGTSSYTGGTRVDNGVLIFAARNAVPTTGAITASTLGYVGAGYTEDVQTTLIDRLSSEQFFGIIGLDTVPGSPSPSIFTKNIDLSGLANYNSVGTQTTAFLSGEVKIANGSDYKFGGGGGTLYVSSNLTARGSGMNVVSPFGQALKLVLQGTNSYSGSTNVLYSMLVLDAKQALNNDAALNITGPGYVGFTENTDFSPNAFLGRVTSIASSDAIVGLDSHNASIGRTVADNIDLSLGGTRTDPYYLGTSSRVTLTGAITPTVGDALYLTAVKGGYLTVKSQLGANLPGVVIGQANSFDPQGGTVELLGHNSYTGGTQVLGGKLRMGSTGALGTGLVSVGSQGTLELAPDATLNNGLSLARGARLSGWGTVATPGGMNLTQGAILSPGGLYRVGSMTFSSGLTLGPAAVLEIDIASLLGTAGSVDTFNVTSGALNINSFAAAPITISLYTTNGDGQAGLLGGFDATQSYSWQFASATNGITGFYDGQFTFNTTGFLNDTANGSFFVSQSGNSLTINFTPVPEPSTYLLFGFGALIILWRERRLRR